MLARKAKLFVVGSGSQARYVIENARRSGEFEIVGIADIEKKENIGKSVNGIEIMCTLEELSSSFPPQDGLVVVAYGKNDRKQEIVRQLDVQGYKFATIISPQAYLSESATVKHGAIINPMAAIMPNAYIGAHCIVHSHVVVEHDCYVGDFANIGPGVNLAGRVYVGEGCYVYTGASVIPGVRIGAWSVVGAGAVVLKDVHEGGMVGGVPARALKENEGGRQKENGRK